jgi:hypothetical protein
MRGTARSAGESGEDGLDVQCDPALVAGTVGQSRDRTRHLACPPGDPDELEHVGLRFTPRASKAVRTRLHDRAARESSRARSPSARPRRHRRS